ncbi:MAG: hypothetical protein WD336_08155 [Trueperaceae bacterium]
MRSPRTDLPEEARTLLQARYAGSAWTLLHAWIADDTVLAVVAVADDVLFDPSDDAFDVDGVRIETVQAFDTLQDGWDLAEDGAFPLGDVFGELIDAFERSQGDGAGPDVLES